MIKTWTATITKETIPAIVEEAAKWNLNVDYLDGVLEEAEDFNIQRVYAVLSCNLEFGHAVFTEHWDLDFDKTWHRTGETEGIWERIELIQAKTP
jgi:hypothetical protein